MPIATEEKPKPFPPPVRAVSSATGAAPSPAAGGSLSDKLAFIGLALLIAYATARNICQALLKPFWYDEICTVLMVQQEHLSGLWQALIHGADGQPLIFYLLERAAASFIGNENLAYRGLSILGFAVTLLCLFIAVRTRKGAALALVCAAVPLATALFDTLSVEARPYSMLTACIAFVCYQRVPARPWVFLLGLSLVLAESLHYFAVFAFLPFLFAEAAYFATVRRFRRGVWIALCSGFLLLVPAAPFLAALQKNLGAHNWSLPTVAIALNSYSWYFLWRDSAPGLYLAAMAMVAVLFVALQTLRKTSQDQPPPGAPLQELALVLGLLALPMVGFSVALLLHGGMIAKYLVASLLGFPLALGFTLPRLPRWSFLLPAAAAALLLWVLVPQERRFWSANHGPFVNPAASVEQFVAAGGHPELPVLVSDPHDFLVLQHYADPAWRKRFVSVLDPEQALVYTGNDTADQQLAVLRRYTSMPVYDFQPFLKDHPQFLVYSSYAGMDRDWWPTRLRHDGFKMQAVSLRPRETGDYFHRVFLVSR